MHSSKMIVNDIVILVIPPSIDAAPRNAYVPGCLKRTAIYHETI